MTVSEVRKKFLKFFESRGHAIIPSASLVPENDPTTLFTGSGMQPLIPYLLGARHPKGKCVANSQKCFRTEDIDEVGDNRHTTFFEMLGNWSFGDYWKEEQLPWFFEFLTKDIGLKPENIYVTVFSGGEGIDKDSDSIGIWQKLFSDKEIVAEYAEMKTEEDGAARGMKKGERIFGYGVKKNWWSRAGVPSKMPAGEPGGPDSEVFYDFGPSTNSGQARHTSEFGKNCHPNCDCGRFLEIGNSVFMEYKKKDDGSFEKLAQRNVDFGGGLERITAASNNDPDIFNIDTLEPIMRHLPEIIPVAKRRIIADHSRAMAFLIADGVRPSNKGSGYVLRRIMRRAMVYEYLTGDSNLNLHLVFGDMVKKYHDAYPELREDVIVPAYNEENSKFLATFQSGLREFHKLSSDGDISGKDAFMLFSSYGLPPDTIFEFAKEKNIEIKKEEFDAEFEKHRNLSRTASAGTFKGGLADTSEKTTRLHTAHHLLLKALQIVLGPQVKQRGSNITSERLRMDFSYDGKMTDEQKKETERIVNEKIAEDLPVVRSEIARDDAEKLGAEHEFGQKYPDRVSVYSVGPKSATPEKPQFEKAFSLEFCGGPHVKHTGEIGKFRIAKEEAVGAGVRRIKGVIEVA
ncbi:MAG: alanine--tRNA ligase [Candidatus Liptonbacteria bacterium]|nr:alanine--tRNA ligase [Candidatus Liptonbacteria bacterium]